jgi:hypothetical protein
MVSIEMVKYLIMVGVLVVVLWMYFNHFAKWKSKLEDVPMNFKLFTLHMLRIAGTLCAFLNFFVYIVGSYFLTSGQYNVSNVLLVVMSSVSVACVVFLLVVTNGFKVAIIPVIGRGRFYNE